MPGTDHSSAMRAFGHGNQDGGAVPDRPADRDQRQADREALNRAFVDNPDVLTGPTAYVLAEAALPVVAAAREEEAARWQAKIGTLAAEFDTSLWANAAARLRAVLDGEQR